MGVFGVTVAFRSLAFPFALRVASVPDVLADPEASDVCAVPGLFDITELLAGVGRVSWGLLGVAFAVLESCFGVGEGLVMALRVVAGFFSVVAACVWSETGLAVGLDLAADEPLAVATASVVFAGIGVCIGSLFLPASSVVEAGIALLSLASLVPDGLPPSGVVPFVGTEVSV